MIFIPGQLISAVTFPGVIVHEFAHHLFCKITKTPVIDVCYFRFGNPAGYVVHEKPKDLKTSLLIDIGPFFVNNLLGILLTLPSAMPVFKFGSGDVLDYMLLWLGISILMHSFPSRGDAKALMASINGTKGSLPLKILCYPIVVVINTFAFGSIFWLDLVYGIALAMVIPNLLLGLLT